MKTALITGAAGYLGSHLAKSLKKSGWKVVGLGHRRHTMNQYIDIMHYADVRNMDDVDEVEKDANIYVDHLKDVGLLPTKEEQDFFSALNTTNGQIVAANKSFEKSSDN